MNYRKLITDEYFKNSDRVINFYQKEYRNILGLNKAMNNQIGQLILQNIEKGQLNEIKKRRSLNL